MKKSVKVFKKLGLFLLLALALLLLVRCEKDPVEKPKYTIETIASSGGTLLPTVGKIEVTNGDSLTIASKPENGYEVDVMKVDGNIIPIPKNLSYTFKNVTSNHKFEATYKKVVLEGSLPWNVMQVTWKLDSTYIHPVDSTWSLYKIWGVAGEMQKTIKFLPNGKTAVTINGDSTFWDGYWRIDETKTPPEIHFAGDAAALKGAIYVLEGDLKNRLVLARYNSHSPFIVDSTEKGDYKYVYTPLK